MQPFLDRVRFVLVRTFHPGNIGSAARSLKTMGLKAPHLVAPKDYPSPEANKMAAGAEDVLEECQVHDSIEQALMGCRLVIATTARVRGYDLPALDAKEAAQKVLTHTEFGDVAIVFGPERMGLHNDDLATAQYRLTIPANPDYSSLNLAAAVQIMSYELYQAWHHQSDTTLKVPNEAPLPPPEQFVRLYQALEEVLQDSRFLRAHQGETLDRVRQFIRRAEPTEAEMNIMLGALRALQRAINTNKQ